jgi:hypothetical protein
MSVTAPHHEPHEGQQHLARPTSRRAQQEIIERDKVLVSKAERRHHLRNLGRQRQQPGDALGHDPPTPRLHRSAHLDDFGRILGPRMRQLTGIQAGELNNDVPDITRSTGRPSFRSSFQLHQWCAC